MRFSKWEKSILCAAALSLCFSAGWFARGSDQVKDYRVETEKHLGEKADLTAGGERTSALSGEDPPAAAASEPMAEESPQRIVIHVTARSHQESEQRTGKVNINTATAEELMALPNIGEKRAAAIIADREARGPFQSPEDLMRVQGIGEGIYSSLSDQITVE